MAEVIRLSAVVGHVVHRVTFDDILRVLGGKLYTSRQRAILNDERWYVLFTVSQSVGMVAWYSYMVMVNPYTLLLSSM